VPGLVAPVAQGDEVHVEAIGRSRSAGRPVERGSLFRIASTTKPITATATLALVREGLFDLDEPVNRLPPELANRRVMRRMDGQ
jgi:CubicO group peptidase (beta-lactamase class C family)